MHKTLFLCLMLLTVVASFVGGAWMTWNLNTVAIAHEGSYMIDTLQARSIKLVDNNGMVLVTFSADEVRMRRNRGGYMSLTPTGLSFTGTEASAILTEKDLTFVNGNRVGVYATDQIHLGSDTSGFAQLHFDRIGPTFKFSDKTGMTRAIFGTAEIVMKNTGETRTRPINNVSLFNGKGDLIWQAP